MNKILKKINIKDLDIKKIIIIGIGILAFIIIAVIVILSLFNKNKNMSLDESLTKLGQEFYENNYYPSLRDKELLANYVETGLNVDINSLSVLVPIDETTKQLLSKKNCDYQNTKLIFIPNSPYGSTDYTIKVELACEK